MSSKPGAIQSRDGRTPGPRQERHRKNDIVANPAGNSRNGKSKKTLKGDFGELPIEIPSDRHDSCEPQIVNKHQTRWADFDEKILSL